MGTSLFDNPTPSISNMMGLLSGPQQPMQPVTQQQMPLTQPNLPPPQQPKLVDRLQDRLSGLLQSVRPKHATGYEGLLSSDEVEQARPGIFRTLFHEPGKDAESLYRDRLDHLVKMKQYASDLAQQKQGAVARQRLSAKMTQAFPSFATMSPEQQHQAITAIYGETLANGFYQDAAGMASVIPSMNPTPKAGETSTPKWEDFGGYKALMSPDGTEIKRQQKAPSPRDPNAPDTAQQMRDQRMFAREQQLGDDFNNDTKSTREMANKVAGAIGEAANAKRGDGIAQTNLLYAFVSAMDPNSAVREGEIGLVRSAGSLPQQAQALLAKVTQGQSVVIPPQMIDQMVNLMKRRLEGSGKYIKSRADYYRTRGKRWGVDPSAFPELDLPAAAPSPAQSSNPLLNPR